MIQEKIEKLARQTPITKTMTEREADKTTRRDYIGAAYRLGSGNTDAKGFGRN